METFWLMLMMGASSCVVEGIAVKTMPWLSTWLQARPWLCLPFSLLVSWILGKIFAASGLIVLGAGLVSTVMMQLWYTVRRWWAGRKATPAAQPVHTYNLTRGMVTA